MLVVPQEALRCLEAEWDWLEVEGGKLPGEKKSRHPDFLREFFLQVGH